MGHRADYVLTLLDELGCPDYELDEKKLMEEVNGSIRTLPFTFMKGAWRIYEERWVNFEADMDRISRRHPTILFKVQVDFADVDQWYVRYWLNGKTQRAERIMTITYPPYDPDLLT